MHAVSLCLVSPACFGAFFVAVSTNGEFSYTWFCIVQKLHM